MPDSKFLVCIGSSPTSEKCIRWTSRTAAAFQSPWIAVNIENEDSISLTEEEKNCLHANMELVEQLGAEVVSLNGYDIASTVADYAKRNHVTNIVIGKSRNKKTIRNYFDMPFEDKLISLLIDVEIHIIPNSNVSKTYKRSNNGLLYNKSFFSWRDILITIATFIIASSVSILFKFLKSDYENMIMIDILSVLVISRLTSSVLYGIVASVVSVFSLNYIFTEPYFSLSTIQKGDAITLIILLVVSIITSTITVKAKNQADYAVEKERRTELLYEINRKLLVTRGLSNIINLSNEYMVKIFHCSTIFYSHDPLDGASGILLQSEEDGTADFLRASEEANVAHWVFANQKSAGAGTERFMNSKAFYIPVISQGNVLGVIGLSCANGKRLNQDKRSLIRMIASQMALSLERQRLSDRQSTILVETEKEKMRSNLLRAISHDLRTPLTGILGACSTILESAETIDNTTKIDLITNIKEESQWLIRMVENLLAVTRLDDASKIIKTKEAAEEIIASAISRIRKRFKNQRIVVHIPDEFLLVPMDGILIEQVIINLVENAIKHTKSDTQIMLELKKEQRFAIFEVKDNGDGLPQQELPNIFNKNNPCGNKSSDSSRGMGIGLSICMSIIKAHNGKLEASNQKGGGAIFRFVLPMDGGDINEQ